MHQNRSIPRCTVIPELAYRDVREALAWLCDAFGFTVRLEIGNHRAQLNVGDGAVVVTELRQREGHSEVDAAHAVMVRVDDADSHYEHARQRGAQYCGRRRTTRTGNGSTPVVDPGGHQWTFSQSIADIDPTDWGGTPGTL